MQANDTKHARDFLNPLSPVMSHHGPGRDIKLESISLTSTGLHWDRHGPSQASLGVSPL